LFSELFAGHNKITNMPGARNLPTKPRKVTSAALFSALTHV
jgi:hypothetical protein